MTRGPISAGFLALAIHGVWAVGAEASDMRAQVESMVYASPETQDAYGQWADDRLRAEHARIEALPARDSRQRIDAMTVFNRDLAAKDLAYAQAMIALRGAITDIGASGQGEAALARFRAGDAVATIAFLDLENTARDRARRKPAPLESAAAARRVAALAWEARLRGKLTTDALTERYETLVRLDRGVSQDWMRLHQLYQAAGRAADAARALDTAAKVAGGDAERALALGAIGHDRLVQGDLAGAGHVLVEGLPVFRRLVVLAPHDPDRAWDLSLALMFSGYDLAIRGDRAGARGPLEEGARLRRGLTGAGTGPRDQRTEDFVAVALGVLGGILADSGDLVAARQADDESHDIFLTLSSAEPGNARWAMMKDATLGALAEVAAAQGDYPAARRAFDEMLAAVRLRAIADPANRAAQRALADTLETIGQSAAAQGDLKAARAALEECLAIVRRLAAADAGDLTASSLADQASGDLGDVLSRQGDPRGARKAYARAVAGFRRRASVQGGDASALGGLAATLAKIGYGDAGLGELVSARQTLDESLTIALKLAQADPTNADLQSLIAYDQNAMGELLTSQGDLAGAESHFLRSLGISRRLASENPASAAAQTRLAEGLIKIAIVLQGRGDPIGAQANLGEAAVTLGRQSHMTPADPTVTALSRAVAALTARGQPLTWETIRVQTDTLFRQGALPAEEIVWLRAVRMRASREVPQPAAGPKR